MKAEMAQNLKASDERLSGSAKKSDQKWVL
jgi:hypothetical protein